MVYPCKPQFFYIKVGCKGVFITRTCLHDEFDLMYEYILIMKSLDPLRAKKTFIRKKLGHTAVSASKASSVTL